MNDEYIEVDSIKEINELINNEELYWYSDYQEGYILKENYDESIFHSTKYYKKNPNYKKLEFNKYVGKRCITRDGVLNTTITKSQLNGNGSTSYKVFDSWYYEDDLLEQYIIEGINETSNN